MEDAWTEQRLTVQIATKLNRSHLVTGEVAYLLPCLGRTEEDMQATGPQAVSMEDTFSPFTARCGEGSPRASICAARPRSSPASPRRRCPPTRASTGTHGSAITVDPESDRGDLSRDLPRLRRAPLATPGGFYRGNKARERIWETKSRKAQFTSPVTLTAVASPMRQGATGSSRCAATTSSTRPSTATATGCAASRERGMSF